MKRGFQRAGVVAILAEMGEGRYLAVVKLSKLFLPDYQRQAFPKHKLRVVFDPDYMPPIIVSLRDGQLNVVDGCQRRATMEVLGITTCLAVLHVGKTYEDEARMFFWMNDIPMKMNGWKKFYAALKAGNQSHASILAMIHRHNLTVPGDPQVAKQDFADVNSSRAVLDAYNLGGLPLLDTMCKVLSESFRIGKGGPVDTAAKKLDFLRGLMQFLFENQKTLDLRIFVIIMRRMTPEGIREVANHIPSKGRIDAAQIKAAINQAYRGGLKDAA